MSLSTANRPAWLALTTGVALAIGACKRDVPAPVDEMQAADAPSGVPSAEPAPRPARASAEAPVPGVDPPLEHFFSGRALDVIQQRSQPAPQATIEDVATHVARVGEIENCSRRGAPQATRLIDLDDDGQFEAISFYELSGCGDNAVLRVLGVFHQDGNATWRSTMDIALSVVPGESRPVLALGAGSITIAGGSDGFGGLADPEVVELPATVSEPTPVDDPAH